MTDELEEELEDAEDLPPEEEVYRLAELPTDLDRVPWDIHEIGVWYFDDEEEFPHELSIFRGAELTPRQAQEFRKFQDEDLDERFTPYRRAIGFTVEEALDCGDWRILHRPTKETDRYRENPHHAGIIPWSPEVYEGNFTHARRCLVGKADWAGPVEGTVWDDADHAGECQ